MFLRQPDAKLLSFCLFVQLDTIKFKVPAANKPAVQKAANGGKNGQWILTINTLPPTFCTHQLAICQPPRWRAYQRFWINFVADGKI